MGAAPAATSYGPVGITCDKGCKSTFIPLSIADWNSTHDYGVSVSMARRIAIRAIAVVIVVVCVYRISPLARRSKHLQIEVERERLKDKVVLYTAAIENQGYLPIVIGRCFQVTDDMGHSTVLLDELQIWDADKQNWNAIGERSRCGTSPLGVISAEYSDKFLWPRQRLRTRGFAPIRGRFRPGDNVRFVVFTDRDGTNRLPSPPFAIEQP